MIQDPGQGIDALFEIAVSLIPSSAPKPIQNQWNHGKAPRFGPYITSHNIYYVKSPRYELPPILIRISFVM